MTRTALITGATGFLGRQVVRAFEREGWTVVGTGYTRAKPPGTVRLDLGRSEAVARTLDEVKPQVIVHCAANRFPDKCDNDPEGTRALNIEASRTLASSCASRSIILIYISTDYVFPGTEGDAPYEASHAPKPPNLYGETKRDGELAVLEEYTKARKDGMGVVLRVPVLYGEAEKPAESAVNCLMDAVSKAANGTSVDMDHWAIRYPTNTQDVGRVCQDIAVRYLSPSPNLPTILQFSSEDKFTKYEICQLFARIKGSSLANMVPRTEGNDPSAAVQRPYDCHLSTKALKDLGISVNTVDFKDWWKTVGIVG